MRYLCKWLKTEVGGAIHFPAPYLPKPCHPSSRSTSGETSSFNCVFSLLFLQLFIKFINKLEIRTHKTATQKNLSPPPTPHFPVLPDASSADSTTLGQHPSSARLSDAMTPALARTSVHLVNEYTLETHLAGTRQGWRRGQAMHNTLFAPETCLLILLVTPVRLHFHASKKVSVDGLSS